MALYNNVDPLSSVIVLPIFFPWKSLVEMRGKNDTVLHLGSWVRVARSYCYQWNLIVLLEFPFSGKKTGLWSIWTTITNEYRLINETVKHSLDTASWSPFPFIFPITQSLLILKAVPPLSCAKYQSLFGICALSPSLGISGTISGEVSEQQVMALLLKFPGFFFLFSVVYGVGFWG